MDLNDFQTKSAAKIQQILHICKRSEIFLQNKIKFYLFYVDIGRSCSYKAVYNHIKEEAFWLGKKIAVS